MSTTTKIGLLTTLLAALIGGTATVVAAMIGSHSGGAPTTPPPAARPAEMPTTDMPTAPQATDVPASPPAAGMPPPDCPTCAEGGETFTEQAGAGSPRPTFRDPRAFAGRGPSVQPGQQLEVVCRFHDPDAPESVQPGWWYLIASPPWERRYYTVANSYLNGDPPEGPYVTDVDSGVPVC